MIPLEIEKIEKRVKLETELKEYKGDDRIVWAEDKRLEIEEEKKLTPPFRAMSGLTSLDDCLQGFRKGQLIVVSGPPKHGKTAFCQTLTKHFIAKEHKVLWLPYELTYEEMFDKFPLEKMDFTIPNYMQSGNLDWVEKRIIESIQKHGTEIVFIDHLDFLRDPDVMRGISLNFASYVGGIVQRIKSIAVQNKLIIFLMTHIRKNKWTSRDLPSSEELRDTGQIAQLADIVLMIMRKRAEKDAREIYEGTRATLGVMENRHNGKTPKIGLELFDKEFKEAFYGQSYAESMSKSEEANTIEGFDF